MPTGGLGLIYGQSKLGKSYLAIGLAEAISTGKPSWLTLEIGKHGRVAFFQADMGRAESRDRVVRLNAAGLNLNGIHWHDRETAPFPFDLKTNKHYEWLRKEIEETAPILVIVDTLRDCFAGDENDSQVMRDVMMRFIAASRPAAILFLAHPRKAGQNYVPDLIEDFRGSSQVTGKMDAIARLTPRAFEYKSRRGSGVIPIRRTPVWLWEPTSESQDDNPIDMKALQLVRTSPKGRNELARTLIEEFHITESTARRKISQAQKMQEEEP